MKKDLIEKYQGTIFSDVARRIANKYTKRDVNTIERRSYDAEMKLLATHAEAVKAQEEQTRSPQQYAWGGIFDPATDTPVKLGASLVPLMPQSIDYLAVNQIADQQNVNRGLMSAVPAALPQATVPLSNQYQKNGMIDKLHATMVAGQQRPESKLKAFVRDNDYAPAIIGELGNIGLKIAMLAGGAEKEPLIQNPNQEETLRVLARRMTGDIVARNRILSQQRAAEATINNSTSGGVRNANLVALNNNTQTALAGSAYQASQQRNALDTQYAQMLNAMGESDANRTQQWQTNNAQNRAAFRQGLMSLGADAADVGRFMTKLRLNKKMNDTMALVLNQKYPHFNINQELTKVLNGSEPMELEQLIEVVGNEADATMFHQFLEQAKSSRKSS